MHIVELYKRFQQYPIISTDTRKIIPGSIFFALRGASFNGNVFAEEALSMGAALAVVDEPPPQGDEKYILVEDVLRTLQDLATYHREQLKIPIIGITGTNGKTTTKELISAVLSQKFKIYATKGNLNNHIGVPLSLLEIRTDIEMGIIEMGANHVGEIALLCAIAKPDLGLITNVGKAHLEGFGSFEGVKKAKGELYSWLEEHNGTLFLQADNSHLLAMASNKEFKQIITYGFTSGNDIKGKLISANPHLILSWNSMKTFGCAAATVPSNLTGAYNLENILAAVSIGLYFGLTTEEINKGIKGYVPINSRSQLTKTEKNTVICDYYNANASSMAAALDNVETIAADNKKVVVLGDMFEMGDEAAEEHLKLIERVEKMALERSILVGPCFYSLKDKAGKGSEFYKDLEAVKNALRDTPIEHALILLKASRGMAFEGLLAYL